MSSSGGRRGGAGRAGQGGAAAGGSGRAAGPARPRLANPYDLGTWRGAGAAGPGEAGPADGTAQLGAAAGVPGDVPADAAPRVEAPVGRRAPRVALPAEPGDGAAPALGPEPDQELYDPPDLPTPADPFELARRTVNRSRAAARDRGLFPISAKTQARDLRDRSDRAPGYSGSRPDPRDPQGIQSVLKKVLGNLGWMEGMSTGRVLDEWDEIVGERIATHCRPVSFEDGVLVVSASSSAWAAQLRMLTPQLITTIEEHVGSHVVSELKVTGPAAAERSWKKGRRTVTWRGPRDTYG
ncbi:DUF721 domain-containing protein [Brachybacterium aquaticum]|uniref:Putative nucleic acid-binding Zn ribbon protein n=1 Tax=Brachybacterium aquaticum TaxID=1432564 RepID=A0A841AGA9_9MICO|nr:DciA family protein [Brachybacterium aquaticum]MBB5832967.1 putative nucleic acid-binding Zn ribbon protein [Brachybacterium aquaticum]